MGVRIVVNAVVLLIFVVVAFVTARQLGEMMLPLGAIKIGSAMCAFVFLVLICIEFADILAYYAEDNTSLSVLAIVLLLVITWIFYGLLLRYGLYCLKKTEEAKKPYEEFEEVNERRSQGE